MNKEVKLAKNILESKGYKVSKRVNESGSKEDGWYRTVGSRKMRESIRKRRLKESINISEIGISFEEIARDPENYFYTEEAVFTICKYLNSDPSHIYAASADHAIDAKIDIEDWQDYRDSFRKSKDISDDPAFDDLFQVVELGSINGSPAIAESQYGNTNLYVVVNKVKESRKMRESIRKRLKEASSGLNYEDMRYWNPNAIGDKVAEVLGSDATEEEIRDEINNIITDDYDRGDIKSAREKAFARAQIRLEMDRDSQSHDPMDGHKYEVSGATPNYTETGMDYSIHDGGYKDDPKSAIVSYLRLSQKNPTEISINTNKNAYAQELLQWVVDNEEEFRSLCDKYNCPYKVDYMVDACKKKLERPSNFENKYNYPDQIYPFALG